MECSQCRHPLTPQHKFCSECGAPVASDALSQHGNGGTPGGTPPFGEAVGKYWRFAQQSLAAPASFSARLGGGDAWNSSVTVVICSFFMANLFYLTAGNVFDLFMGFLAYFPYRYGFLDHFVRPFFWLIVLHAVIAGSVYAASRLMKAGLTFKDIVARYGALLTAPAILFALSSFFALIGVYKLASFVSLLGIVGLLAAAGYTVYSCRNDEERGGLDAFYGVMAAFVIAGMALYFIGALLF